VPRYVILKHDHPELHWDFMLEAGEVLKTWRLADRPRADQRVRAEPSFDHRRLYLDYEGPVSGNRGSVVAWDRGTYEGEPSDPAEGRVVVKLTGGRLRGTAILERGEDGQWGLRFTEEG
jgi:hypothetical protein